MAPLIQMRFEESQVRRALVRVLHADGDTAGTAFFVTPDRLVTCFHVIASRVDPSGTSCEVSVVLPGGEKRQAVLDEVASAPQLDIAVFQVRCEGTIVLPCGLATEPGQAVWTSGFHKPDQHAASDVPTNAWLGGRVVVVFEGPPANRIPGLTLESATIRPGSSGAPLIDRDTGAVIGIVDAEHFHQGEVFRQQITIPGGSLDGYAIALDGAANEHPPLAALVEENRRSVPAFGRYLNGPGARHLCRLQAEGAVRELTNSKYFNPATYTPRQNLTTEIHRFVRSPKKLMPVVGYTGVGKTTSLCHLAGDLTEAGWAVVLLRGVRVAVGTNLGLDGDIAKILTPAGDSRPYDLPFFLEAISPAPLVVLLDALNEVVYQTDPELRAWWGGTIDWLARSNARALVTSRLQTWEGLKGDVLNDLFFHPANPDPGEGRTAARTPPPASGTYLGDFSPDEYVMARWRYGLAGSEFRSDLARHPFFLRMWSEIRDQQLHQGLGVNPTAYELLELYAEAVARNVSRATGRSGVPSHTPPQIGRLLHDLGADALANQANLLTASQVEARLVGKPGMLAILVGEHVIEEGRESYRFAFDSIAEYLMSHHIDPTAFTEAQVRTLARYGSDSQAGALGLALLRAEHAGRHAVVAAALDGVMRTRHSIRCLALLLADFRDAPSHLERLRRAAQQGSEFGSWYSEIVVAVSRLLHSGRIPVAQVVDLFRPAFVHDDPYRFEWGHWQGRWSTPEFEADCGMGGRATLSKAILDAFDTYPQETMGVLLEWLGDRTAFAERGSVHIEDVAAAFLYHRRLLVFDELCDALAGHRAGVASLLLSRVIGAEPTRALTILDRWSQEGSASRDLWVARLAGQFTSADPKAGGERLAVILDRIWDRLGGADAVRHNDLFLTLVTALSRCESRRDRVFDLIREWCLQSASGFVTLLAHPHRKWSSYAALA